jgi:anaerobic selenocysteine-containing dehydrogenase
LYNRETNFKPTHIVKPRIPLPYVLLNREDAVKMDIEKGDYVDVSFEGGSVRVRADVSDTVEAGAAVLPRHLTDAPVPLHPTSGSITKVTEPAPVEA